MTAERIDAALSRIERDEQVRVLYACESGSRAWGFASQDSDYDARFIYVRPAEAYIRLVPPRDVIEMPIVDDLDVNGWDLFKACHLLRKTNPPLLEWLRSPIVYRDDGVLAATLRGISAKYFNVRACAEHYLRMAARTWTTHLAERDQVWLKKYLYAVRPILCIEWLMEHRSMPPMRMGDVREELVLDDALNAAIDRVLEAKQRGAETEEAPACPVLTAYIDQTLQEMPARLQSITPRSVPTDELDALIHRYTIGDRAG